jgi:hypothetical protein
MAGWHARSKAVVRAFCQIGAPSAIGDIGNNPNLGLIQRTFDGERFHAILTTAPAPLAPCA